MIDGKYTVVKAERRGNTRDGNPRFDLWLKDKAGNEAKVRTQPDSQCAFYFSGWEDSGRVFDLEFNRSGLVDYAKEIFPDEH